MFRFIADSWLSCRKYAERASQSLDHPLTFGESVKFRIHHILCFTCRRFRRQILEVEKGLGQLAASAQRESPSEGPCLSEQARCRMEAALRNEPRR